MNDNDRIFDFIMGDLDKEGERQLFASLAYDEDLRDEMKTMMTIKSNIGNNIARYVEPVSVKSNIFRSLGYSIPGQISTVPTTDIKSRLLKRSLFTAVLTCLISVAGTIIIMTQLVLPDKEMIYFTNQPISSKLFSAIPSIAGNGAAYKENDEINIPVRNHRHHAGIVPSGLAGSTEPELPEPSEQNSLPAAIARQNTIIGGNESLAQLSEKPIFQITEVPVYSYPFESAQNETGTKKDNIGHNDISIEIRNSESWFLPKETIDPAEKNSLNNYSITSLYGFSPTLSAGPDIRQETFYVEYSGTENGSDYRYYQQPNLTTFGVALRYKPFDYNYMKPFVQFSAGINKAGYIARAMSGAEIFVTKNIGFVMGVEYNLLLFSHDRKIFPAQKFNLNYGLIVRY